MTTLSAWLFALLVAFRPPATIPELPGHEETEEQTRERYHGIADDIAAVALEYNGPMSERNVAALLASVAVGETQLAKDTDEGSEGCYRGKPGGPWWKRCDSGTSATLWQLKPILWEGERLTYRELFKDRRRAARIALKAALGSLYRCRKLPAEDRLSALGGSCIVGHAGAQGHYHRWMKMRAWEAPKP